MGALEYVQRGQGRVPVVAGPVDADTGNVVPVQRRPACGVIAVVRGGRSDHQVTSRVGTGRLVLHPRRPPQGPVGVDVVDLEADQGADHVLAGLGRGEAEGGGAVRRVVGNLVAVLSCQRLDLRQRGHVVWIVRLSKTFGAGCPDHRPAACLHVGVGHIVEGLGSPVVDDQGGGLGSGLQVHAAHIVHGRGVDRESDGDRRDVVQVRIC